MSKAHIPNSKGISIWSLYIYFSGRWASRAHLQCYWMARSRRHELPKRKRYEMPALWWLRSWNSFNPADHRYGEVTPLLCYHWLALSQPCEEWSTPLFYTWSDCEPHTNLSLGLKSRPRLFVEINHSSDQYLKELKTKRSFVLDVKCQGACASHGCTAEVEVISD
jgi:hypothetical protein